MSKYIIEIPDYVPFVLLREEVHGKFITKVVPTAELEELNSDYINEHFGDLQGEAYKRGHDDGYEAGCATAFKPVSDTEYQRGLEDAWVAVRKIVSMPDDPYWELFGDYKAEIIKNTTVSEVIARLKAYEESKNKICVGDIVYFKGKPEIKACVTAINESGMETTFCGIAITNVETYCSVGNPYSFCRTDDWCKTGERFDVEQLWKGEDNA